MKLANFEMIHINILSAGTEPYFYSHWDKRQFTPSLYDIQENSHEDIIWDYVVVYEQFRWDTASFKCRKGGLIFVAGEPPLKRPLPRSFLKQFDYVILPNLKVRHPGKILSHGFLNWSLGFGYKSKEHRYTYADLQSLRPEKTANISIVTSTKNENLPGYRRRMKIINRLEQDFPGKIDFYGIGREFVDFKADALLPYRFHICMENCEAPYYWTEKFADPVLAYTIPIYAGCTNIDTYFSKTGYITFRYNEYKTLKAIIEEILKTPEAMYHKYYKGLLENRKILMEKENLIPFIISLSEKNNTRMNKVMDIQLKTIFDSKAFKPMVWKLFLVRCILNLYNRFK
jgi:hypothetical protein